MPESSEQVSERELALDVRAYLRDNPGVCVNGSVPSGYLRYSFEDFEWQVVRYATEARHWSSYVHGRTLDEDDAVDWLLSNPVTLAPTGEHEIWQDARSQDVFTSRERCTWCGASSRTEPVESYRTVDDGVIPLCDDCRDEWRRSGELASNDRVEA